MPPTTISLALLLLCQCSGGGSASQDRPTKPGDLRPAALTVVLQRDRDATEQLLLRSDGQMIWVRFYGTRVLDTSLTKLKPVEVRKFHDLAKGLAGVPQGKRDEEHMDGAEFTVLQAPPSASSGGKRDSKKKPAKSVVLKPVKVTTRHEDLVAKDLRKALHMAFDRKRPSKRAMRGAWVRARDFASAMGLDANDAKDVGALLTRQKLVAVPAPGELTDALRWPGVLIPFDIDKLPKAKPGKPLIVQSSDRYFVVDAWSFARK